MRILGIVVPLVGGFLVFALPYAGIWVVQTIEGMILIAGLLGLIGVSLFRSWWALAIVPVALAVGQLLGAALPPILQGNGIDLQAWAQQHFEPLDMVVILGVVPAVIGAAIGIPIGKWMEERLPQ